MKYPYKPTPYNLFIRSSRIGIFFGGIFKQSDNTHGILKGALSFHSQDPSTEKA